jgi:ribosomal protein L40E
MENGITKDESKAIGNFIDGCYKLNILYVGNSGNPLMFAKCDKCGMQILSWKNFGIASLYENYDKENFKYTGNIEQWVCNRCTAELGYDVD